MMTESILENDERLDDTIELFIHHLVCSLHLVKQPGRERSAPESSVQQKVSDCFRTEEGVAMFCRIRSSLSTLRKQGLDLFSALEHTLSGHPVFFVFP
jgi:hypothetical protein